MSYFQGDHLRISTPQTTDGSTLAYVNGQPKMSIQFAPLEARRAFERENEKRPTHLKHIIEVVTTGFGPTNIPQPTQTKVKLK